MAAGARLWAPLRLDTDITDGRRGHAIRRFSLFASAYGMQHFEPSDVVDAVLDNHDWLYTIIRSGAEDGNVGYATYWEQAEKRAYRTRSWYTGTRQILIDALT